MKKFAEDVTSKSLKHIPSTRRSVRTSFTSFVLLCSLASVFLYLSPSNVLYYTNGLLQYLASSPSLCYIGDHIHPGPDAIPGAIEIPSTPVSTGMVQWDTYSLIIKGQRVFLNSGEFHPWRLPVPTLWLDILQKVKAAGLNAISIYTHWGLTNPSPGVCDFDGFRSLQTLFDAAKETGLWVVLRPGPYINAETTAGGIAHWVTSQVEGRLRTNSTDYKAAWEGYIKAIIEITVQNQIDNGGPVIAIQIDNEYNQYEYGHAEYFQQLENFYRNNSIVVPLTYNDAGMTKSFINGTGAVDIYGIDAYPQRFDCSHPFEWYPVETGYRTFHEEVNPSQPLYSPEFQAGAYDPWGPNAPGYDFCRILTNSSFQDVFYKSLWADNAKMINYYMIYGGTSWGYLPFPGVYTSYDYGSPIKENRFFGEKYRDLKRQALFIRSSPDFYETDWIGNNTSSVVKTSNADAFVTLLENRDSKSKYFIARQLESSSMGEIEFQIEVNTSKGLMTLPRISTGIKLSGRESKIIVVDYSFGKSSLALYSTASVLFAGVIGGRDILFLYGNPMQTHESAIFVTSELKHRSDNAKVLYEQGETGAMIVTILDGFSGIVTIIDSDTQLVLYSDTQTAGTFFSPLVEQGHQHKDLESSHFKNYWQFGTNSSILVGGPYLVRSASISGIRLQLHGDIVEDVRLTVIAPSNIRSISWNDQDIDIDAKASSMLSTKNVFVSHLFMTKGAKDIEVPTLKDWRYADSLPEIQAGYSDKYWLDANHTKTNIPFSPHYGDGTILYGCDYGFCEGITIWRGHFTATGHENFLNLSINGGAAFAASVWLNNVFIGTTYGNSSNNENIVPETNDVFYIPKKTLAISKDNVITVVQDNMGLDEDEGNESIKSPRGIRGFDLHKGQITNWKVQGKLGGYYDYPDKVRGIFNEGGTYSERQGWHLPGFDTSSWKEHSLLKGLPNDAAGIGTFVTTFDLKISDNFEVAISFNFEDGGEPYRALLFVNGWMMGKRVANLGPQKKFPVHQGILDYSGTNTVAVILWVMESEMKVSPKLYLSVDAISESSLGRVDMNNPPWQDRSGLLR